MEYIVRDVRLKVNTPRIQKVKQKRQQVITHLDRAPNQIKNCEAKIAEFGIDKMKAKQVNVAMQRETKIAEEI